MLVVLKIKAKQKPEQVWDSVTHFLNYTQDRKLFKEYNKIYPKNDKKYSTKNFRALHFLTPDNKSIVHIYIGNKEIWELDWKNYWTPHKEKQIWDIEELTLEELNVPLMENGDIDFKQFKEFVSIKNTKEKAK
jgi:hypothetical protein|tara:strand:- start:1007 stop:1405 length:399 start_codon:yes stop_codon:yes gene_type:complete